MIYEQKTRKKSGMSRVGKTITGLVALVALGTGCAGLKHEKTSLPRDFVIADSTLPKFKGSYRFDFYRTEKGGQLYLDIVGPNGDTEPYGMFDDTSNVFHPIRIDTSAGVQWAPSQTQ